MTNALRLDGVSAFYGPSQILHELSLSVEQGRVTCLLGLNGMGKTTTHRTIMGLVDRIEGEITLDGVPLTGKTHRRARTGVTLVPEDRKVFPNLTVIENLTVAMRPARSTGGFTLDDAKTLFPRLEERFEQKGNTLSGGEQQMLVMARAMLANPKYMLLDEPTEGLAPQYVEAIRNAILSAREHGIGVLLVEQNLPLALAVGDKFHVLENGELVFTCDRETAERDSAKLEELLTVE